MPNTMKILIKPSTNLESVIVLGYQNTKALDTIKDTLKIGQKIFCC